MATPEAGNPSEHPGNSGDAASPAVNGWNAEYIERLYEQWKADPSGLPDDWNQFFLGFDLGRQGGDEGGGGVVQVANTAQGKIDSLIYHYRDIGHFAADLDPLGTQRPFPENLTLESFGLSDELLDEQFDPGTLPLDNPSSLRTIIEHLEETYCRHIGAEYMHIQDRERRRWLQRRMETVRNRPEFSHENKMDLLQSLVDADGFEAFLRKRYVGKKRFGLEGGESLIPIMDQIIEQGPANGIKEFAIGMAHRGRLNVLVNILKKSFEQIFTDFEESWVEDYLEGGGDVKYHSGYSNTRDTRGGQSIHLTLAPNPSHLEFVTSVVLGRCRAKQRVQSDEAREQVIPLIVHGDAAFPGQGVVAECFNMMSLDGYTVGGTIHLVLNNQVGFTTNQKDSFSGRYCTDIAKMIDAPIFHVNGDDPEACAWVARVALEYRQAFNNDVVIDMWCYRRNGHNESDEPSFTQPMMYRKVREKSPVLDVYGEALIASGDLTSDEFQLKRDELTASLEEAQARSKEQPVDPSIDPFKSMWSGVQGEHIFEPVDTGVAPETLHEITRAITEVPEGFTMHKTVARGFKGRESTREDLDTPVEWGTAELLAYGSLLLEGHAVRLSGQDVERGTFSHRHSVVHDQETGEAWTGLNAIHEDQARFCVHNSPLSECAVVGFEYGYSLADPQMLIIWEAQFGDFANGAQVIFDQFVASAETKWKRSSGLTLFLPHGYEGQGPEHSSARLERFLSLCADNNMQVCAPTSGAQLFHMLRRQVKQPFRKPLVVMTPKSMLRLPQAKSTPREMTEGSFQTIIDDHIEDPTRIEELILCSGKIFYELDARRNELERTDVAIIRFEQLYPLDVDAIRALLARYEALKTVRWVQEEPENSGAWRFMEHALKHHLGIDLQYTGRDENASPAVGSMLVSNREHAKILDEALGELPSTDPSASVEKKPAASREKAASRTASKRRRRSNTKGQKKKAS
jgi:2-oxoglutarate dehydrogenase E1 component